jgi:hypothetical protein
MTDTSAIRKPEPTPSSDQVPLKTWIGLMGAMLGAFMAVLDIQITNSSLAEIQTASWDGNVCDYSYLCTLNWSNARGLADG